MVMFVGMYLKRRRWVFRFGEVVFSSKSLEKKFCMHCSSRPLTSYTQVIYCIIYFTSAGRANVAYGLQFTEGTCMLISIS